MKTFVVTPFFLSLLALVGAVPNNPLDVRQYLECGCGVVGYTGAVAAYYFDSSGTANTWAACSAKCKADSKCKSFGFGEANCLLFDVPALENTSLNPMSPYTFYEVTCPTDQLEGPCGGTPTPSSTLRPSSSKPVSSTVRSTVRTSSSKPPTTLRTTSSKYVEPPKSTSTKKPVTTIRPSSSKYVEPSKTSKVPQPPTKTESEEVGPSSTRCPVPLYYKCGGWHDGKPWSGCTKCVAGAKCKVQNEWYYQCVAEDEED